jgi:hypothetical protein
VLCVGLQGQLTLGPEPNVRPDRKGLRRETTAPHGTVALSEVQKVWIRRTPTGGIRRGRGGNDIPERKFEAFLGSTLLPRLLTPALVKGVHRVAVQDAAMDVPVVP